MCISKLKEQGDTTGLNAHLYDILKIFRALVIVAWLWYKQIQSSVEDWSVWSRNPSTTKAKIGMHIKRFYYCDEQSWDQDTGTHT